MYVYVYVCMYLQYVCIKGEEMEVIYFLCGAATEAE